MAAFQMLMILTTFLGCACFDLNNPFFDRFKKTLCKPRQFGMPGIEVEICETVFQLRRDRKPIHTCSIGKVDPETAARLYKTFGGLLKPERSNTVGRGGFSKHDGDMCCPTVRGLRQARGIMKNALGQYRGIVSLEDSGLYQYYSAGTCVKDSAQKSCKGTCLEEKATVYLMVTRDDMPLHFSFEPFEVPSYCSCKNIGASETRGRFTPEVAANETQPTTVTPSNTTETSTMLNSRRSIASTLPTTKATFDIFKPKYSRIPAARLRKMFASKRNSPATTLPTTDSGVSKVESVNETDVTTPVNVSPRTMTNTTEPVV